MADGLTAAAAHVPSRTQNSRPEGVVHSTFALLRALCRAQRPVGVTGLAAAVGLPKTTAHRLLEQMAQEGVVVRRDHKWELGPGLGDLRQARRLPMDDLVDSAQPRMRELTRATGASLILCVQSGKTVDTLSRSYGPRVGRVMTASEQRMASVHPASAIWLALEHDQLVGEYREVHPECDCIAMPFSLASGGTAVLGLAQHKSLGVESLKRPLDRVVSLILSDMRRLEA